MLGSKVANMCGLNVKLRCHLAQFVQCSRHVSTFQSRVQKEESNEVIKWILLLIPTSTFCLGTWQVQRRAWKKNLIADLNSRTNAEPCDLPYDLEELKELEYCPVQVTGKFDHSQEQYLGPRSLLVSGGASNQGGGISSTQNSGYLVITPFHLSDRQGSILVNRGWVPKRNKNPKTREAGQIKDEVKIVGLVRLDEKRAVFMPKNQPGFWFYRDLPNMAKSVGAEPVFLDAVAETTLPGGPVGGQTRISLPDDHMSYLLTWYGLSACTAYMWFRVFLQRKPLL